jgi:hypothetical protein
MALVEQGVVRLESAFRDKAEDIMGPARTIVGERDTQTWN